MTKSVSQLAAFFAPKSYDLTLDIDRAKRAFRGRVKIRGAKLTAENIRLHAKNLEIISAKISDQIATVKFRDRDEIELKFARDIPQKQILTLEIDFTGHIIENSMHGLYPCYYELGGAKKELLATQFESHHAREVFPCVDEPAAKATFDLTLITEKNVEVLANSEKLWQKNLRRKLATRFATTPKMSTYLLAFVVGGLQKFSAKTARGVAVNVFATRAQSPDSLQYAADVAAQAIDFYENYFGVNYPLAKSDHVALPDFSAGAMENWGLITYRESCLLVDKNSALSQKQYVATVIAHELAHQWFGDLVTMKWWDDLWLNESFASLMEHIATDALWPDWQVWLDFETTDVAAALRRDALPGVQPVRQNVKHPDEISTLFDSAIVYAKGERLLKMLRANIGENNFRAGLKNYFAKFAYENTAAQDLWDCFSAASGQDIAQLMTPWLTQPGYPVVRARLSDGAITLEQRRFLTTGDDGGDTIWPIPLFCNDPAAPQLMAARQISFAPNDVKNFQLNVGDNGHFVVALDPTLRTAAAARLPQLDAIDRLSALGQAMMLARAGDASAADLIDILQNLRAEQNSAVWDAMALALGDLKKIVEDDAAALANLQKFVANLAQPQFSRLALADDLRAIAGGKKFARAADTPMKTTGQFWAALHSPEEAAAMKKLQRKLRAPASATAAPADENNDRKLRATILAQMIFAENRAAIQRALDLFAAGKTNLAQIDGDLRPVVLAAAVKFGEPEEFDFLLDNYKICHAADLRQDIAAGLTAARDADQIATLIDLLDKTEIIKPQDVFYWFAWLLGNRYARAAAWQWCRDRWPWIAATFGGDKSFDMFPRLVGQILRTKDELREFRTFFAPLRREPALRRAIDVGATDIAARAKWIARDRAAVVKKLK